MLTRIGLISKIARPDTSYFSKRSFKKPLWWIKLTKFEYWNWLTFYIPIIPSWLYLGLKSKSLTFFTAVNPATKEGGFLKEDKWEILSLLPKKYLPYTQYVSIHTNTPHIGIFPLVAKPNTGQRGIGIEVIQNRGELEAYHRSAKEDYVLQEFINAPLELAVFYSKLPSSKKGKISSLTIKEFMTVRGDGLSTIKELMLQDARFVQQIERLESQSLKDLSRVPKSGEKVVLEPIGNHCRGTKFIIGNHLISPQMERVFDEILAGVDGFYYGRFDLKAESIESLLNGECIKIMELNGVNGDPAHIFDPSYSLINAYKDVFWHWTRMSKIAKENIQNGAKPVPVKQVWKTIQNKFAA